LFDFLEGMREMIFFLDEMDDFITIIGFVSQQILTLDVFQ